MIVAIDGPAGVGKSTIAKRIALACDLFFINSGNFYRAITLKHQSLGRDMYDDRALAETAGEVDLTIRGGDLYLDGEDVELQLHTDEIDAHVARVSAIIPIRHVVNEALRKVGKQQDIIIEGRDVTTVVFPDADLKFYFDASIEIRAERRYKQQETSLRKQDIEEEIRKRDEIDKSKEFGALIVAEDADYIDTSYLTIDEVCEKVVRKIINFSKNGSGELKVATENDVDKTNEMQNLLQEEYLKSLDGIEDGQLVDGQVVQVNNEFVFVDVGYKSEGRIPLDEFLEKPSVGDTAKVVIVNKEGRGGQIIVSKKKADGKVRSEKLREAAENGEPVEGTFSKVIKGGFEIDLMYDLKGFCPLSKADMIRVEDPETYIGIKDFFIIDKLHTGRKLKSVLSRRAYLEKSIQKRKDEFFSSVSVGDVVEGEVKSFTSFGAFIDLGGFDGLLHINDMSWGHVTRPKDFVKKGQKVSLKLINIDPETQKINLSLKHFTEDPWLSFDLRYHVEDIIEGKVTKLTDFGVFIELEEGVEGLAHISELSWVKRISHPKEILSIGDTIQAKILSYDLTNKKISLGIKQVEENPWDSIADRYPEGYRLTGQVVKVTNSGAFINLEEGIDGFLHIDDISWTKHVKSMNSFCSEGDMLEVLVTRVDSRNRRIRLGVKQLEGNPWQTLRKDYPKGSIINGEVTGVTDFGVFVRVVGDIEGLISKYNLIGPDEEYTDAVLDSFKEGDAVTAIVTDINVHQQKLSLSIKELVRRNQRQEMSKYIHEGDDDDTFTFADLLKEKDSDIDE